MATQWFYLVFALLSVACCWAAYRYAIWRQLVDLPGERRSHQIATPRGGGAGIVLAMLVALGSGAMVFDAWRNFITLLGLAVLLVAGIGWWDDHRPLPAMGRLLVHLVAAFLVGCAMYFQGFGIISLLAALLLIPVMINFWNFMDGINGLVVSQVALSALAQSMFLPTVPGMFGVCLAISCFVFLPMNFPRAKIFLGDVGSGALGLMLAVSTLLAMFQGSGTGDFLLPLLVLLPLGMDAALTLIWRFLRKEDLTKAHRDHLYQWAVRSGFSHGLVTSVYFFVTIVLFILAMVLQGTGGLFVFVALTLAGCGSVMIWLQARSWIKNKQG